MAESKIWTTLEEVGKSEEGCPKKGKGDGVLCFGRLIRRKVRLTQFSPSSRGNVGRRKARAEYGHHHTAGSGDSR